MKKIKLKRVKEIREGITVYGVSSAERNLLPQTLEFENEIRLWTFFEYKGIVKSIYGNGAEIKRDDGVPGGGVTGGWLIEKTVDGWGGDSNMGAIYIQEKEGIFKCEICGKKGAKFKDGWCDNCNNETII